MKSEIEAKFLSVDIDKMRQKLADLGAQCERPMSLMRRVVIETPDMNSKNAFVRARDEAGKITITYKQFDELSVDGAKEIELIVDDFDKAVHLLDTLCPIQNRRSYQESRREVWRLNECEIVIDKWPWIKPYIEIEGSSESELKDVTARLGLKWEDAVFGDVMAAYRAEYPHLALADTVGSLPEVMFDMELPRLLKVETNLHP